MSSSGSCVVSGDDRRGLFAAGGWMAARLAVHDWAGGPLGAVDSWPGSLRTAVAICLHSPLPAAVWWGPQLVLLYNDAFRPILGPARGEPVGLPGAVVWSQVWDRLGPLLDGVLTGGGAVRSDNQLVLIDRHGYPQECYFTFSFSAIVDESGQPGGVFTTVTETTDQVVAGRRWRLLGELAGSLVEAGDVEQVCARAAKTLAAHGDDVTFVEIHLAEGGGWRPVAAAGAGRPTGAAQPDPWPVAEVGTDRTLRLIGPAAPTTSPTGPAVVPATGPAVAAVAPIGQPGTAGVAAVLVLGLSPRLPADDGYRDFVDRVAGQIGTVMAAVRRAGVDLKRAQSHAKLAAQQADLRFRSLVEAATAVVWSADATGAFVLPQPSWQAYTGQPWPAHSGDGWLAMVHEDDRDAVRHAWQNAVVSGQRLFELTGRVRHADSGGYRHCVARAVSIRDHTARITEWVGTLTDVHDRVTAESVAQRSAAISDALLTASPVGFGWVDTRLRFQRVNPALCALNHLPEAEHLGRRPSEIMPVPGLRMEELMRRALEHGPITGVDISAVPAHRPDVGLQHVVASYFPIRISGTHENVGVGFTVVDVTERTHLVQALGVERARYDRLAATDVLAVFSGVEEQITEANEAFLSMLGYTAEELRAGRLRWTQLTPPGWEHTDERALSELRRTGRVAAFDKEYLHRNGSRVPVLIGVVALDQQPLRWLAYAADLSAERAAQAELRLFRALVERSGDFVAVADAEGHTVYVNPAGRELVGLDDARAVRRTGLLDYAAPQVRERWRDTVLPAAVRHGHHRLETALARFDTGACVDVDAQVFTVGSAERDGGVYLAAVARDVTERQGSLRRAQALARFAVGLSAARGRRAIATAIVTHAHAVFDAAGCAVAVAGTQRDVLDVVSSRAGSGPPGWYQVPFDGPAAVAATVRGNRTVVERGNLSVPLRYGDGTVLGALMVSSPRGLADDALNNVLDTVTGLCSEALQRAELSHATEAMAALAARLSATRSTQEAVQAILAGAPAALGAALPAVAVRESGPRLRVWQRDLPDDLAATYRDIDVNDPRPLAEALRTGRRIVLPDREAFRRRYPQLVDHAGRHGLVTTVALPLLDSRRRPVAALGLGWSGSRPFRDTDLALLDTVADLCEQTLERTRLVAAEHDLVTRLAGRLSATATAVPANLDVAVRYQPAVSGLNLGGDWYDLIALGEHRLAIVVGDVVGHHVEAAADMAQLRTIINTLIRLGVSLGEVFPRLTALLGRGFLGTALAMRVDTATDELAVTRAGHPNPVLVRPGARPEAVDTANSLPLGLVTTPMTVSTIAFRPGDVLVAYTDGLVERRSRPYDEGVERLHAVIERLGGQPVQQIADTILSELSGSDDDQALVVIRRLR